MVLESRWERYLDSRNGDGRPMDYEELDGLLAKADRSEEKEPAFGQRIVETG